MGRNKKKRTMLDDIYQDVQERKENGCKCGVDEVMKMIHSQVEGDKSCFLRLEAQEQAVRVNLDIGMHVSIAALAISLAPAIVTATSSVASLFSDAWGCISVVDMFMLVSMLFVTVYAICVLAKIIKFMGKQEDYNYIGLCLKEYGVKYFSQEGEKGNRKIEKQEEQKQKSKSRRKKP